MRRRRRPSAARPRPSLGSCSSWPASRRPTSAQTVDGGVRRLRRRRLGHRAHRASRRCPRCCPVDVPLEATLALATATLSSGGQGFGRASTFFPGTLTTGVRPLIETAAGTRLPLPDYPIVVEAREFDEAKHTEVPGRHHGHRRRPRPRPSPWPTPARSACPPSSASARCAPRARSCSRPTADHRHQHVDGLRRRHPRRRVASARS